MKVYAKTDVGKVREMNQDYFYISKPEDKIKLYIIADGMGGYKGGEIASRLAVEASKSYIYNNYNLEIEQDKEKVLKLLRSAIEYANFVIFEKSKQMEELENMGILNSSGNTSSEDEEDYDYDYDQSYDDTDYYNPDDQYYQEDTYEESDYQ